MTVTSKATHCSSVKIVVEYLSGAPILSWVLSVNLGCEAVYVVIRLRCNSLKIDENSRVVTVHSRETLQNKVLGTKRALASVEKLPRITCNCC